MGLRRPNRRRRANAWVLAALFPAMVISGLGCAKALFPKSSNRTQYDQYDRLRGQYVSEELTDVYGRPQPALRARLTRR